MGVGLKFPFLAIVLIVIFPHLSETDTKKLRIPPITRYLIENDVCNMPYFDPWAFKERFVNKTYVPCSNETPFVYFENRDTKIYAVLNETIGAIYRNNSLELECCVSNITRNFTDPEPDNSIGESTCVAFNESIEITTDVVRITCFKIQGTTRLPIYEDIHGLFVSYNLEDKNFPANVTGFNVLMIVIDSVSHANFIRHLPKTHTFLVQNNYVNLRAYNQVGKNAIPNAIPLLTGYSHRLSRLLFGNPARKFFDDYNFIWKEFQNHGYITAYAEDYSKKQTFNDKMMGFNNSPTTYYFRGYTLSSDKLHTTILDRMPHCVGPSLAAERILNLALDFATTFHQRNYFGLFWLNSFSRDDFNAPGRMDEKLVDFFRILQVYQHNTITFFLSDNGYYRGDVTKNIYGWFESRLPFHYVHVPQAFRAGHMDKHKHLAVNARKLVSPYDIYATLQDILEMSASGYSAKVPRSCRTCTSLFKEMPEVRTCKDAGIDRYWCTCLNKKHVPYEATNETDTYFVDTRRKRSQI